MIIAAAQIGSRPGAIAANIDVHLAAIELAARNGVEVIVFPELSLTGYEPSLARELAIQAGDDRLRVFRDLSRSRGMTIGIGMPTKTDRKPRISQLFFRPFAHDMLYSKRGLHADERPCFEAGDEQACLRSGEETVVPAICHEALNPQNAVLAATLGATAYVACAAKHEDGARRAHAHLREVARRHEFAVVLCNAVGRSDNFVSAGSSAAWNRKGEELVRAGRTEQCVLLVDLASEEAAVEPLR